MAEHTIQLSDSVYQWLLEQAARLDTTPARLIEQWMTSDAAALLMEAPELIQRSSTPPDPAEALAAVQRLTTLFADVRMDALDEVLNDPMLALANADPLE